MRFVSFDTSGERSEKGLMELLRKAKKSIKIVCDIDDLIRWGLLVRKPSERKRK